jgi:hypothetical protein
MISQIFFKHRRLEQLLTIFTSKAGPTFIKKMDEAFQNLQVEASHHYNQGLQLKEPLTTTGQEIEKMLMHMEIKQLKEKLSQINEDYEGQIKIAIKLQDQLSTLKATVSETTKFKQVAEEECTPLHQIINNQNQLLKENN